MPCALATDSCVCQHRPSPLARKRPALYEIVISGVGCNVPLGTVTSHPRLMSTRISHIVSTASLAQHVGPQRTTLLALVTPRASFGVEFRESHAPFARRRSPSFSLTRLGGPSAQRVRQTCQRSSIRNGRAPKPNRRYAPEHCCQCTQASYSFCGCAALDAPASRTTPPVAYGVRCFSTAPRANCSPLRPILRQAVIPNRPESSRPAMGVQNCTAHTIQGKPSTVFF